MKKYLFFFLLLATGCSTFARPLPRPAHVVIVIEENKSYQDIIGSPDALYIKKLVQMGASLTQFYAFHHPSQPNYFEIFAGTHVITIPGLNTLKGQYPILDDSCVPLPHDATQETLSTTPSLGGLLGDQFRGYAENWDPKNPSACPLPPKPLPPDWPYYAQKHAPWTVFRDSIAASYDFKEFPTTPDGFDQLPWVSIVVPDLIGDMHSQPGNSEEGKDIPKLIKQGDDWLEQNLDAYVQWAMNHNSLLIITFDESSNNMLPPCPSCPPEGHDYGYGFNWPQNHILTIFVGEMVKPGSSSDEIYNHHDLLRTIEDMYGLSPYLGGSANARDITGIWK